ncbi:MAG: DUF4942 domain-containing protein [Bacteroidales bacterium]|nr:DUF4942 domain-containing protein [Bacteroidales bacterium]
MFDKEFYPTPTHVLDLMQIDCTNKIVLEPSAGKGDMVDYLIANQAKQVIAFEKHPDLNKIVATKCIMLGYDFFDCTPEQISHIDLIVMNPPFSNADKHILHAWNVAPEGCEIIALCNYETISNPYYNNRRELNAIIQTYGITSNLGDCFSTNSERKTGVEIGLIKLYKPVINDESKFEGFFFDEDEDELQENGIMAFNEVRALVNRYVGAIRVFDKLDAARNELTYITSELGLGGFSFTVGYDNKITTKEEFSKHLQKISWKYIFDKMNMAKYVTSGVMKDINKFVEEQQNIPFTMKNVYKMFDIIVGTRQNTYNRALEEAIDNFTKHTHENRYNIEGWKTNSGYMLNKKFIVGWCTEPSYRSGISIKTYNSNFDKLLDLTKVICNLVGENYDCIPNIQYASCDKDNHGYYLTKNGLRVANNSKTGYNDNILYYDQFEPNKWYEWGFFEFKVFKKGTMHLKFKDEKVWHLLNQTYGKLKGFSLPDL